MFYPLFTSSHFTWLQSCDTNCVLGYNQFFISCVQFFFIEFRRKAMEPGKFSKPLPWLHNMISLLTLCPSATLANLLYSGFFLPRKPIINRYLQASIIFLLLSFLLLFHIQMFNTDELYYLL